MFSDPSYSRGGFLERRFGFCQRTKWRQMEDTYNKNQWKFMEEMCILVDSHDRPIGSDSKRNCTVVALALHQVTSEIRKMDRRCVIAPLVSFFSIRMEGYCYSVGLVRRLPSRCTGRIRVVATLWIWTGRLTWRTTRVSNGRSVIVT